MILTLKNISLSFARQSKNSFRILNGLNMRIPRGKITALVGGNGVGKTTLFNVISGLQTDFSGEIYLEDKLISGMPAYQIARAGIGRMFQGNNLIPDLTLLENMKIASNDQSGEWPFVYLFQKRQIDRIESEKELQAVMILNMLFGENNKYVNMLHHKASTFSYGEQRLIALSNLLMGKNKLLLLDEPTAGVNPVYIETIESTILKMVKEKQISILMIEHNMHFVRKLADYCVFLNEGKISHQGNTDEILGNQELRNSYLGL